MDAIELTKVRATLYKHRVELREEVARAARVRRETQELIASSRKLTATLASDAAPASRDPALPID